MNPTEQKSKIWSYTLWTLMSLFIIIFGILIIYYCFFFKNQFVRPQYKELPKSYVVNDSYLIPTWNQLNRGTCWIFSTISVLEAQYKHQGIMKGYLKDNEYVELSKEWYGKLLTDLCAQHPTNSKCKSSSRNRNTSSGGTVQDLLIFANEFPIIRKQILPESACPYNTVGELNCPSNINEIAENNPISFKITDFEVVSGIQKGKDLLYRKKIPITFSIPLPAQRYTFECKLHQHQEEEWNKNIKEQCDKKVYQCPWTTASNPEYCYLTDFPFTKNKTTSFISHNPGMLTYTVGHAMVLVGYNDEFVEPLRVNTTRRPLAKGGFILRNSWGNSGHSIDYLMGKISDEQEEMICPNKDDVFKWIPANYNCVKETINNNNYNYNIKNEEYPDISKCNNIKRYRGNKLLTGPTILKCINGTHCQLGSYYVLSQLEMSNGIPDTRISKSGVVLGVVSKFGYDGVSEPEVINTLPFEHLNYAFSPMNEPENDLSHCGHVFYTYDAIEEMMGTMGPNAPTFRVASITVKFGKQSYANSGLKYDYSYVLQSTKKYSKLTGRDPYQTPYEDL